MKVKISEKVFIGDVSCNEEVLIGQDGKLLLQRASDNAHKLLDKWLAERRYATDSLTFIVMSEEELKSEKQKKTTKGSE